MALSVAASASCCYSSSTPTNGQWASECSIRGQTPVCSATPLSQTRCKAHWLCCEPCIGTLAWGRVGLFRHPSTRGYLVRTPQSAGLGAHPSCTRRPGHAAPLGPLASPVPARGCAAAVVGDPAGAVGGMGGGCARCPPWLVRSAVLDLRRSTGLD